MPDIRVAIADDHKLFRQSLGLLIESVDNFDLIFTAENGLDFLKHLQTSEILPDVVLLDIDMPGMNGIELNRVVNRQYPQIKVVMLSVHLEEQLITQVVSDGAASYLTKNCDKDDLVKAIETVHKEGFYINQLTLKALTLAAKKGKSPKNQTSLPAGITNRENEVLQLICQEHRNPEIAQILYISVRTVEGHRNNLLAKTGCHNSAGLVLFAIKNRLFEVPV